MNSKAIFVTLCACTLALATLAGVEQTVTDLIPRLADAKVESRYGAQMDLQRLAANAARPGAEAERAELARVLAVKAADAAVPQPARVWMVRQLEYIGAAESVPALTALLSGPDAELKECARRALEKNSAPAATESLRAALKQGGDANWQIGLIQSLGERGDAESVSLIAPCLGQPAASFAAAQALGKIASEQAVQELWGALDKHTVAAADALVIAANRLVAKGDTKSATAIYTRLFAVSGNAPLRAAALIGLAKADPDAAKPLIAEALSGPEPRPQSAAITAAQEVYGPAASSALANLLRNLRAPAKVLVLRALDASAQAQLIAAAGDPSEVVRLAALERLGQVGTAACAPVLFQSATAGSDAMAQAAVVALARISAPGADAAIAKAAAQGDPKSRIVAFHTLAARHDSSAAPALLTYAAEPDSAVSAAACAALAKLGTDNELDGLIQLVLAGKAPGAPAALQAVAGRARDKSAAAQKIIALTRTAPPEQAARLFEILALLGGNDALIAVSSCAGAGNDEIKDAAIRALANWSDFTATRALLIIASDPKATRVHTVLALQAVARLVKSSEAEPASARLKAALTAMNLATRDEEKTLLLSALAAVPDEAAGEAIRPYLNVPRYQQEAGLAAVTLAESLRKTDKPAAKALAQAVKNAAISDEITRRADSILKKK